MGKIENFLESQGIDVPKYENARIGRKQTKLDIQANINEVKQYALTHNPRETGEWFKNQIGNNKRWDFKQLDPKYETFGNIHYGIVGKATGLPTPILFSAAGGAQFTSNYGYNFYLSMGLDFSMGLITNSSFVGNKIFSFHSGKGFGLLDNFEDGQKILFGLNTFDKFNSDFSNPIVDNYVNKLSDYFDNLFKKKSAEYATNPDDIPVILIDQELCTLCGLCIMSCRLNLLKIEANTVQIDFENMEQNGNCTKCMLCMNSCYMMAIEVF